MHSRTDAPSAFSARALNLVNCGLVVLDASKAIVLWNGWMVPRSGYSAARVRQQTLTDTADRTR